MSQRIYPPKPARKKNCRVCGISLLPTHTYQGGICARCFAQAITAAEDEARNVERCSICGNPLQWSYSKQNPNAEYNVHPWCIAAMLR